MAQLYLSSPGKEFMCLRQLDDDSDKNRKYIQDVIYYSGDENNKKRKLHESLEIYLTYVKLNISTIAEEVTLLEEEKDIWKLFYMFPDVQFYEG